MSNTLKIPLTYSTNVTGEENRTRERERAGGESDQILNTFKELSVFYTEKHYYIYCKISVRRKLSNGWLYHTEQKNESLPLRFSSVNMIESAFF